MAGRSRCWSPAQIVDRSWQMPASKIGTVDGSNLIFLAGETHAAAQEQFRTLRSRLYQMQGNGLLKGNRDRQRHTRRGKSFVSANLAHAFALQSDRRVLMIDADIRRAGGLSTLLGAPCTPGLTDYLLGEQHLESIIQAGSLKNLYLIPCGSKLRNLENSSEIPASGTLIEKLRPAFDGSSLTRRRSYQLRMPGRLQTWPTGPDGSECSSTLAHLAKRASPGVPARKFTRGFAQSDVRTIRHVLLCIWLW